MNKVQAITTFWNRFLIAYEENTVPNDAKMPYITYQVVTDGFNKQVSMAASLWYRGTSWVDINAKTFEIEKAIGKGGIILKCDDGVIWIKLGSPFAQNMKEPSDDLVRRKYLNIEAEFLTAL